MQITQRATAASRESKQSIRAFRLATLRSVRRLANAPEHPHWHGNRVPECRRYTHIRMASSSDSKLLMRDAPDWTGGPYEYNCSRGLYYHEILPGLFCGSQPRNAQDVQELKQELNLTTIISLLQPQDLAASGLDGDAIKRSCSEAGINLVNMPVSHDVQLLRKLMPSAAQAVHESLASGGRVYVHCTGGLGRAPTVLVAYLHWYQPYHLDQAITMLTSIRPCQPMRDAVRGATFDLMVDDPPEVFDRNPDHAYAHLTEPLRKELQARVAARTSA